MWKKEKARLVTGMPWYTLTKEELMGMSLEYLRMIEDQLERCRWQKEKQREDKDKNSQKNIKNNWFAEAFRVIPNFPNPQKGTYWKCRKP
jgi:hypothetical protein